MTLETARDRLDGAPTGPEVPRRRGAERARQRRRRRRLRVAVTVATTLCLVILGVPFGLVMIPRADPPTTSDAILVLGPSTPARVKYAERLMSEHKAGTLVISDYDQPWAPKIAPCRESRPYEVACFYPLPGTTLGEARELRAMAAKRHWTSVQVITFDPHVNRARYVVEQCFSGQVSVLSAPSDRVELSDVVHHMGGWIKAPLSLGC